MNKKRFTPQYITVIAMFSALSFISVIISRLIPNVAGFLSYEPKDALIVIAGFIFGPTSGVIITVLVSFIEMVTISSTGPIGFLMNVISTSAFVLPPTIIYKNGRTKKNAIAGLSLGVLSLVICMLLWNYIITPMYMEVDRATVSKMLLPVFLPFNLIKGGINTGLTLLLYKPAVTALRSAHLVEEPADGSGKASFNLGYFLISLAILVTFILAFLALIGVI